MSWTWNPLGAFALVVSVTALALALLVLFARPGRVQNRALARILALEGFILAGGTGLLYSTSDLRIAYALQFATYVIMPALPFAYLLFLGTLGTPVVAPFRHRSVRGLLWAGMVGVPIFILLRPELVLTGMVQVPYAHWDSGGGPYTDILVFWPVVAVAFYSLAAAGSQWWRSPRVSAARRQGGIYASAFAFRDSGWIAYIVVAIVLPVPLHIVIPIVYGVFAFHFVFLALLAYGILQAQLFDIDLKVKFAIESSTVAAFIAGLVFIMSEVIEQLLGVDQIIPAVIAAGAIALALRPLLRLGQRVADRLMPGVTDTDAYRTVRKHEVYRAALESAAADSEITHKERSMLTTLQEQLGLSPQEVHAIETEVA